MTEQPIGQDSLEGGQGDQEIAQPDSTAQSSINPAWNDLLGVVPSQLHSQVTPHLTKWDQNFQSKINEVHSQYEPWKKYQDGGVSPEDVDYALGLLNALSENPQEVVKALNEWAGIEQQGQFNQTPAQTDPNAQQPEFDDTFLQHPKVQEMQRAMESMAQILLEQRQAEQQAEADTELENDLTELKTKYGEFDEEIVLALAMKSDDFNYAALEQAVQKVIEKTKPQRQPGPPVLGSGSAIPASTPDPRRATDAERKQMVAAMLAQAQQNS